MPLSCIFRIPGQPLRLAAVMLIALSGSPCAVHAQDTLGLPEQAALATHGPETTGAALDRDAGARQADESRTTPNRPLAFGFLEYDWDASSPAGVPGFDNWSLSQSAP